MEKGFIPTDSVIFCQACGAKNAPDNLNCKICKAPLVVFSLTDKEEKLYDNFNEDVFIFDEIRAIKDVLSELKKGLLNLNEEIKNLKKDIRSIFNGFSSFKEVLEEKNLLKTNEIDEKWKEKEVITINAEDQLNHFLKKKENILAKYKGKDFQTFAELLEKALKKFQNQNVKGGMEFLKRALKKDLKNVELLNLLAFLNLKNRDFKEANYFLKKSLNYEENSETIFLKAWLLSSEKKYGKALNLIRKIKNNFPNPFLINVMEGNLNFSLRKYEQAANSFEKALKFEENPYVRFLLFKSLNFLNKKNSCLMHLEKIKDEEFYREEALYNLGKINLCLNKYKIALNYFQELLEEYPSKFKYQICFLIVREKINLEIIKKFSKDIELVNKKLDQEDFKSMAKNFLNLYKKNPEEPFFLLSYLFFSFLNNRKEEYLRSVERFLKEKNCELYRILGYLIYIEMLKNISNDKLILKVSKDFYNSCKSNLGKAISLLFLSQKILEVERDEEVSLKLSKEALILLPEDLKVYGIENFARIIYKIEKKEEVYDILKELSKNLKDETILLNLGKIALNLGKEKDAKEIFKSMRDFQGKPQGIVFKYWKQIFKEIRSYLI